MQPIGERLGFLFGVILTAILAAGCSDGGSDMGSGGASGTGGTNDPGNPTGGSGGAQGGGSGGTTGTGGTAQTGGSGGSTEMPGTGGRVGSGGLSGSGGASATGGRPGTGGGTASGGVGSGGATGMAGRNGSGGAQSGGMTGTGGTGTGGMGAGGATVSKASRPSYNKGTGFFVLDGKLYDANGVEFRIRGVNKVHWDATTAGLAKANVNTVRWNIDFTRSAASNVSLLRGGAGQTAGTLYNKIVVMPGAWSGPGGSVTCSQDPATLNAVVSTWVAQASTWAQLEQGSIINIANEWGPQNSTVWRDSYISAISQLRAAGLHATLSITSGGCGQDNADLLTYASAVFDSDPEKNVIFDRHIYGGNPDSASMKKDAAALAALGLPIILGEFGPGRDIGPSPTNLAPDQVIQAAEQYGLGWMAWAWDDTDMNGFQADNEGFGMSYKGNYDSSADLTMFGQVVQEGCTNPAPGGCGCPDTPTPSLSLVAPGCQGKAAPMYSGFSLKALAAPATIF